MCIRDRELPELKSSLETINKTANKMITDIDRHFAEVKKERGLDNEMLDIDKIPDPNITLADMNSYGYSYENMLPLTQETAEKLFNMDAAVYMLHYDDTEALVIDASEIKNFNGIFGIEKADWEKVKDNYLKNAEMAVEDDYNTYRQEGRTSEARLLQGKSTECIDGIINNGDNRSTVSKLEENVKSGKSISLLELAEAIENEHKEQKRPKSQKASKEKPSLIAKLKRPLPPQDKIQPKSKEREM